eukprot:gene8243-1471_t
MDPCCRIPHPHCLPAAATWPVRVGCLRTGAEHSSQHLYAPEVDRYSHGRAKQVYFAVEAHKLRRPDLTYALGRRLLRCRPAAFAHGTPRPAWAICHARLQCLMLAPACAVTLPVATVSAAWRPVRIPNCHLGTRAAPASDPSVAVSSPAGGPLGMLPPPLPHTAPATCRPIIWCDAGPSMSRPRRSSGSLGEAERYLVMEADDFNTTVPLAASPVATAALDLGHVGEAEALVAQLRQRFPKSSRVARLDGLVMEATPGKLDLALTVYDKLLEDDPTDAAAWKRKVAVKRAQGLSSEAMAELKKYIAVFQADSGAVLELAELHVYHGELESALLQPPSGEGTLLYISPICQAPGRLARTYEELLLLDPNNSFTPMRMAEVNAGLACQDDREALDRLQAARRCYGHCISLNPNPENLRAFLGLWHCCSALKKAGLKGKDNQELLDW